VTGTPGVRQRQTGRNRLRNDQASGNFLTMMNTTGLYVTFAVIALAIVFVLAQSIINDDDDE